MADRDSVELRTECPRETVDVLDAFSMAHRINRGQLVVRILSDWARERLHEHSVLSKVARLNPDALEDIGKRR